MSERSIFVQALDQQDASQRAAYLDQACGGNAVLRKRLDELLAAEEQLGDFLSEPVCRAQVTVAEAAISEGPGTVLGPYKLLQQIGEGGMGVVYLAEQQAPVRRKVALKIIKPGMDSKQVIARFEIERQVLAMMEHVNIARVLDAGATDAGRPYFVMELVHGVPITTYCDQHRLTPRQRLELFVPVCQAIQHAHQKGVIHRDIKPSNVLVTTYDDKPVPKVIDFGVAKAVEQRLTEKTMFTEFGALVGTFEYMSPEQAEMNSLRVDTRSDIYSLGVLLYELLAGATPLERQRVREAAYGEIVRLIKEEEPLPPSSRLSMSGAALDAISQQRGTDPNRLCRLVRGELDWIVMKCLEKDLSRRYESASGLARDVQRYLHDEPVDACPPSLFYQLQKIACKNRVVLTTASSFAALLLMGAIVSTWLAIWAMQAQQTAETALANERIAREEAVAAKDKAESFSQRLEDATRFVSEGADFYYRSKFASAHGRFTKAAQIEPNLYAIYIHRAALYTYLGLWKQAAADYDRRFDLASRAGSQTCYENALLQWYVANESAYLRACQEIVKQYGDSLNSAHQLNVVRACVLAPEPVVDPKGLVRRAERLVSDQYAPRNLSAAGRAHLRAGNLMQAADRMREAIGLGANTQGGVHQVNYAPLAIALHRLGRTTEAKQALGKAEQVLEEWTQAIVKGQVGAMPISWWDWLDFLVFHREAKTLITGLPPADDPRLTAIQERGLAIISNGDAYSFMDAGREQILCRQWEQAAACFAQCLEQLPDTLRPSAQTTLLCQEMTYRQEVFERLVALRPGDSRLPFSRSHRYARQRQWTLASAEMKKVVDLRKEDHSLVGALAELAAFHQLADEQSAYRELCEMIVKRYGRTEDSFTAYLAARACLLAPDAVPDWTIPLRWASQAVASYPREPYSHFVLGAVQYRAGQDAEALNQLSESIRVHPAWIGRGQSHIFLALACHRLGRAKEAHNWLAKSQTWLNEANQTLAAEPFGFPTSVNPGDWLSVEVLLREAAPLVAGESNP